MAIHIRETILRNLLVKEAMRRQVIRLPQDAAIGKSINSFIKYKINAILTTDGENKPAGVVSKTDIMGAYYAGLPLEYPLQGIMSSPPLFCQPDDSLEDALDKMKTKNIYRLYIVGNNPDEVVGVLAYPDIVGLLYRYCHTCKYSQLGGKSKKDDDVIEYRFKVKDIMTRTVRAFLESDSLLKIMEGLSQYRFGAMLIRNADKLPVGVVSKTDLILAYKHGLPADVKASTIMSSPVSSCHEDSLLEKAIQVMIFSEVHRLFVHKDTLENVVGVISLSDAARLKSGSCHACVSSRIKVDEHD